MQRVGDQLGAHVVGDRPAGQPPGEAVDHGGQVEVRAVGERQVGDVADVAPVRRGGGEVPVEQVGHLLVGRARGSVVRTRRRSRSPAMPCSRITRATRLWLTRSPAGAPSLSSAVIRGAPYGVVARRGRPGSARPAAASAAARCGPGRGAGLPGVERGALDLDELAQPLHLEGVLVVGDELEAAHQFVSPAKYLAAWRRISRSVASLVVLGLAARATLGLAAGRASARGARRRGRRRAVGRAWAAAGWRSASRRRRSSCRCRTRSSQCRSVPRTMPRSSAMPRTVAPGVDSYKSTA